MNASSIPAPDFIRLVNPDVTGRLGKIRQVFFDFDGTLSVLRQGWEGIMAQLMAESISPDQPVSPEIQAEISAFIDRSTGQLTIRQMEWLSESVARHGLSTSIETPRQYKRRFTSRLNVSVAERAKRLIDGQGQAEEFRIAGAADFVAGLAARGLKLYLASGSDHADVEREVEALGLKPYFAPHIYGALDESEAHDKARLIRKVMDENDLHGDQLIIVGDGPLEITEGKRHGAITLGVASDEVARQGWNQHKVARLEQAGVDLITSDFRQHAALIEFLQIGYLEAPEG